MVHSVLEHRISDAQWVVFNDDNFSLLLLSLVNGQPVCFDSDGQQIKLLSDAIFGQNLIGNFEHFKQRSRLVTSESQYALRFNNHSASQQITKPGVQANDEKPQVWIVTDQCISLFDGASFQTFKAQFGPSPFQKQALVPVDFRRARRIGHGFPLLTVSCDIVLDNKLFDKNEKIFWHLFLACKLYQIERQCISDRTESELFFYRAIF